MKITFIGAAHEVTGSCTLLEACGKKIIIDCGMEQGADIYENCEFPLAADELDAVFLTHAHIDHSGKLPFIVKHGFNGRIHSTYATFKLCGIMLKDSAHIQEQEAEWRSKKAKRAGMAEYTPLYTSKDVEDTLTLFTSHHYNDEEEIFDGIKARFLDAGHLLGSSSILLTITEDGITKTFLFSGDLGNPGKPLLKNSDTAPEADYVMIESTYGDRVHGKEPDYLGRLTEVLERTLSRGGNVVIPAFAIGRTQELLYYIRIIKEQRLLGNLSDFPVYVDSPLAVEATSIYGSQMKEYYDEDTLKAINEGINPISFNDLVLAVTKDESIAINEDTVPKVIISASGMCEAGRIRHHLKHNLWRPDSTILFVGFQSPGTLGRNLLDGQKQVKLFTEDIVVRAEITQLDGFSSHADKNMLLNWLSTTGRGQVFVNHGEDAVCDGFAILIEQSFDRKAIAPYSGDIYDLATGECIEKASVRKLQSKKAGAKKKSNDIYQRLLEAGRRLLRVIEANKESTNERLTKFAEIIEKLCETFE